MELDYYHQKQNAQVASQVGKKIILIKISKLNAGIAQSPVFLRIWEKGRKTE